MSIDPSTVNLNFTKEKHEEYLPEDTVNKEISEGKLLRARLCINRLDPKQGTIRIFELNQDVCIIGMKNINRAINFDTVAVKVLPESG